MKKQVHVYYAGRVQGVGFRYTARDIASSLDITGWVSNLRDGRVEIVAEQEEKVLDTFLAEIAKAFGHHIRDAEIQWQEARGKYREFAIEF